MLQVNQAMMPARVLIVDDSLTMRALFGGILEKARGIDVVGMAASADEARELIIKLRPSVVTLDVEMPGTDGLTFLEEIMRDYPTPVVMLSSMTGKGAETSLRALEIGAVECFCKPQLASPDQFKAIASKLSALVIAASIKGVIPKAPKKRIAACPPFNWNGNMVAMTGSVGGIDAALQILPLFPKNCPPTVILLQMDPGLVDPLIGRLRQMCNAQISKAENGQPLKQGNIYIVADPATHAVIDRWPHPWLRLIASDPVNGLRPSANLLFATVAKTAGSNAVGVMLSGIGTDGAAGLKLMRTAGAQTICQDAESSVMHEALDAARALFALKVELPLGSIASAALAVCHHGHVNGRASPASIGYDETMSKRIQP